MAFRIHEISVHLMGGQPGPCMPASPDPLCPNNTQKPPPACKGKSNKPPHPQGDDHPGGIKKRSLDLLQARLRETLASL